MFFTFLFLVHNYVYLIYHFIHFCQGTFSPELRAKPHVLAETFVGSIHLTDLSLSGVLVPSRHQTLASPPAVQNSQTLVQMRSVWSGTALSAQSHVLISFEALKGKS